MSWRARGPKGAGTDRRPPVLRCRPTLEILEDRRGPSSTPTVMQPPYWTPIVTPGGPSTINAFLSNPGQPFTMLLATIEPGGETVSGVLITWGDGHTSAG